jgi:hypothetical protein
MRRTLTLLASVVATAAIATGAAGAGTTFTDPTGDQFNTPSFVAPDITTVAVSNTPDGRITFEIGIANYPALPRLSGVAIGLDLDKDPATGDDGAEAFLGYIVDLIGDGGLAFDRWDGEDSVEVEQTTATATYANGLATITVPRAELFDTKGFDFQVVTLITDFIQIAVDYAPNDGMWTYDLELAPVTLAASKPTGSPKPHAGAPFVVSSVVTRSDTGGVVTEGAVNCAVRIGSARLRATGRFRDGRAQCAMTIPKTAKGKQVRGTLTVQAVEASVATPFAFRVAQK